MNRVFLDQEQMDGPCASVVLSRCPCPHHHFQEPVVEKAQFSLPTESGRPTQGGHREACGQGSEPWCPASPDCTSQPGHHPDGHPRGSSTSEQLQKR